MIRLAGMIGVLGLATAASATTPACPPDGLRIDHQDAATVVTIIPGCLSDPEDLGVAMAELTRQIADAHLVQNPRQGYGPVEEVLVESYVSEILAPSVSAVAQ